MEELDVEPVRGQTGRLRDAVVLLEAEDELAVELGAEIVGRVELKQPEAKRRMSVRDFLNGLHLKAGDRFGEK